MTTNFPSGLDSFTNPTATDAMDSATVPHADQHADVNDAVEALQAKVGVDGSAVTSSLDYKVANQGLTLVKTQTITGTPTSVNVPNAFSSTFPNYRIIISDPDIASGSGVEIKFGIGNSQVNYYGYTWGYKYDGTALTHPRSAQSYWTVGYTSSSRNSMIVIDVGSPYLARYTQIFVNSTGSSYQLVGGGSHASTTSFDNFTIYLAASTFVSGDIRVYGYGVG